MLSLRNLLAVLVLAAAALFVIGVAIERSDGHDTHAEGAAGTTLAPQAAEGEVVFVDSDGSEGAEPTGEGESTTSEPAPTKSKHAERGGETGNTANAEHTEQGGTAGGESSTHSEGAESPGHSEGGSEEVFGIDAEATPFVVLAVLASLALALAAWVRPGSTPVLVVVALAMLAFAVFDVREVFHQVDESKTGLAVLAAIVAALHLAAAAVAATMQRRADEKPAGSSSEVSATIAR